MAVVVAVVAVDTTAVAAVVVVQAATPHLATRHRDRRTMHGATTRPARKAIANRRHATTASVPVMPPNRPDMANPAAGATARGRRVRGLRRPSADQPSGELRGQSRGQLRGQMTDRAVRPCSPTGLTEPTIGA